MEIMVPSNLKPPLLFLQLPPSPIPLQRLSFYLATASPLGVQTLPMLSFQTPESDTFLCLLPREMVAVYGGRFVPLCPGTEWGNERQTMRGEEMEGRVHDKEPFHRCNWYLSFFRKRFLLTEVQKMSQDTACFVALLKRSRKVLSCLSFVVFTLKRVFLSHLWSSMC